MGKSPIQSLIMAYILQVSQYKLGLPVVYVGLAAAVDSKFDWEKLWNNWGQFQWTKKAVSRTAALLFDNNNACILNQNTNTARLCRFVLKGFKSGSGHDSLSGWIGPF